MSALAVLPALQAPQSLVQSPLGSKCPVLVQVHEALCIYVFPLKMLSRATLQIVFFFTKI